MKYNPFEDRNRWLFISLFIAGVAPFLPSIYGVGLSCIMLSYWLTSLIISLQKYFHLKQEMRKIEEEDRK